MDKMRWIDWLILIVLLSTMFIIGVIELGELGEVPCNNTVRIETNTTNNMIVQNVTTIIREGAECKQSYNNETAIIDIRDEQRDAYQDKILRQIRTIKRLEAQTDIIMSYNNTEYVEGLEKNFTRCKKNLNETETKLQEIKDIYE